MRVFAALPLPAAAAGSLDSALASARRACPDLRWVSSAGFHLTLHYVGEVEEAGVTALRQAFGDPELVAPAIPARLGKVGQFPPRGNPRVLWVGLARGGEQVRAYWDLFETKMRPLGWDPDERGFSAHITIARAGRAGVGAWDNDVEVPDADFMLGECVLFQSILGRAGAQYVPLSTITLVRGQ